jgi:hypothetical protein
MVADPWSHVNDILNALEQYRNQSGAETLELELELLCNLLIVFFNEIDIKATKVEAAERSLKGYQHAVLKRTLVVLGKVTSVDRMPGGGNPRVELMRAVELILRMCIECVFGHLTFLPNRCLLIDCFLVLKEIISLNGFMVPGCHIILMQITSSSNGHDSNAQGFDLCYRAITSRLNKECIPFKISFLYVLRDDVNLQSSHFFPCACDYLFTRVDTLNLTSSVIGAVQLHEIPSIGIQPAPADDWLEQKPATLQMLNTVSGAESEPVASPVDVMLSHGIDLSALSAEDDDEPDHNTVLDAFRED